MADDDNGNRGLVSTLVRGARDIPRNASWLAGKAVPHEHTTSSSDDRADGAPDLKGIAQRAGRAVRDALPRTDSVESGLARAQQSAESAREAEDRAVAAAERAHALRKQADAVAAAEKKRLQEVDADQRAEVERRVALATREAEEHVKRARHVADVEADRVRAAEQEASEARAAQAREEAERAQEDARQSYAEATEKLAVARKQAEEAAVLAQDAADRAKEEVERISAQARGDQEQADAAVSQAHGLTEQTAQEAASVTRTIRRTERPVLTEMSKADLLHLAAERGISGRSSMSKKQLVASLEKKQ